MVRVYVTDRDGNEHEVESENGPPLMEALRDLEYGVEALCGGLCSCATCHVYVHEDWQERLPPKADDEEYLLEDLEFARENSRLSCQLPMTAYLDGLRITLAPEE